MFKKLLLLYFISIGFVSVLAQSKVIPFCPSKGITFYNSKLDKKYHLFKNYHKFINAELLQQSDSVFTINIYYKQKGKFYLLTKNINYDSLLAMREKINKLKIKPAYNTTQFDINAKLRFNLGGATSSLLGYSWMVPTILKISNPKTFIGIGLISASLGFFVPMKLTSNTLITPSEAIYKNYGQIKGFADGFIVYSLFDYDFINFDNKSYIYPLSFSIAEGTIGYFFAKLDKTPYITALTSRTYSIYGYYWGAMLGWVINNNFYKGIRIPMLISNFAGAAGGYYISKRYNFTRGDNRILFGTILLSNAWASSIQEIFEFDEPSLLFFSAATVGIVSGTFLGIKNNISATKAVVTNLSSIGAGLFFGGITALLSNPDIAFLVSSTAATGTFIWLYNKYSTKDASGKVSFNQHKSNFNFYLNPTAYFVLKNKPAKAFVIPQNNLTFTPLFSLKYKF